MELVWDAVTGQWLAVMEDGTEQPLIEVAPELGAALNAIGPTATDAQVEALIAGETDGFTPDPWFPAARLAFDLEQQQGVELEQELQTVPPQPQGWVGPWPPMTGVTRRVPTHDLLGNVTGSTTVTEQGVDWERVRDAVEPEAETPNVNRQAQELFLSGDQKGAQRLLQDWERLQQGAQPQKPLSLQQTIDQFILSGNMDEAARLNTMRRSLDEEPFTPERAMELAVDLAATPQEAREFFLLALDAAPPEFQPFNFPAQQQPDRVFSPFVAPGAQEPFALPGQQARTDTGPFALAAPAADRAAAAGMLPLVRSGDFTPEDLQDTQVEALMLQQEQPRDPARARAEQLVASGDLPASALPSGFNIGRTAQGFPLVQGVPERRFTDEQGRSGGVFDLSGVPQEQLQRFFPSGDAFDATPAPGSRAEQAARFLPLVTAASEAAIRRRQDEELARTRRPATVRFG